MGKVVTWEDWPCITVEYEGINVKHVWFEDPKNPAAGAVDLTTFFRIVEINGKIRFDEVPTVTLTFDAQLRERNENANS